MNTSGEAADQVVRMTLNGVEVAAKITGAGAKELAALLYAVMKDQKKTKGKMRLANMLRSGKELKVFAIKDDELARFCREAKKYGVLYCVLKDRDATDGITDIMVRAEDASKINRIFERFELSTLDVGEIKSELEKAFSKGADIEPPERSESAETAHSVPNKEESQTQNPTEARVAKRQSAPTSEHREGSEKSTDTGSRRSVRKELERIRRERSKNPPIPAHSPVNKER